MISRKVFTELLNELFEKNGKGWFRVISDSMSPLIKTNERVLVKKEEMSQIRRGDIILFKNRDTAVTHRVVSKCWVDGHLWFIERGDRGGSVGSMILADWVLGKVVAIEKNGSLLRLDRGWGRIVNTLLGINSYVSYRVHESVDLIRKRFRDKPGFQLLKLFYRILMKPIVIFKRGVVRLLMASIWMGTKWRTKVKKSVNKE